MWYTQVSTLLNASGPLCDGMEVVIIEDALHCLRCGIHLAILFMRIVSDSPKGVIQDQMFDFYRKLLS